MYWVTGAFGFLFMITPFILRFNGNTQAIWTSFILGALILIVSMIAVLQSKENEVWEYWIAGTLGLFAIIAPFILKYNSNGSALWSSIVLGIAIATISGHQINIDSNKGISVSVTHVIRS